MISTKYKLLFDGIDSDGFRPLPNQQLVYPTSHSEVFNHFSSTNKMFKDYCHYVGNPYPDDVKFIYPIEIVGGLFRGVEHTNFHSDVIDLVKQNRCKILINYSHESNIDGERMFKHKLTELSNTLKRQGLKESDILFAHGDSNLPKTNSWIVDDYDYQWIFNDAILSSGSKKGIDIIESQSKDGLNSTKLGYDSKLVTIDEVDNTIRSKRFFCQNRTTNYPHRWTLGCFIEAYDLYDEMYLSFLSTEWKKDSLRLIPTNSEMDSKIQDSVESFYPKMGKLEIDTQSVEDKLSWDGKFEGGRYYKSDAYLDSYINIVTETKFLNKQIFITDKLFHPILNFQPFIVFSSVGWLQYVKDKIGIETFSEFIDESYDSEENDNIRLRMLFEEILRLKEKPMEEIHEWYVSIKPKLINNREKFLSMHTIDVWTPYFDRAFDE